MKLSSFGSLLTTMYSDVMTVYRRTPSINADGTTSIKLSSTAIYENIPCRISTTKPDDSETTREDKNSQYADVKVFCSPKYVVEKGDTIVVTKKQDDGTTLVVYTGTSNLPFVYATHAEIKLVDVGDA